jgi:hypothetical protein
VHGSKDDAMHASSHNPVATLLLLIPMLALPLLAVFGVPQIIPVAPKASDDAGRTRTAEANAPQFAPAAQRRWEQFTEPPATPADSADSAWAELQLDSAARTLAERRAAADQTSARTPEVPRRNPMFDERELPPETALLTQVSHVTTATPASAAPRPAEAADAVGYKRPPQSDGAADNPGRLPRNPYAAPVPALTWQAAVKRLNDLEIRNYRLEPGHQPDQFVFICSYTPPDNPRVSYRFEAEADEPLRAVEKVLAQIDGWLAGR